MLGVKSDLTNILTGQKLADSSMQNGGQELKGNVQSLETSFEQELWDILTPKKEETVDLEQAMAEVLKDAEGEAEVKKIVGESFLSAKKNMAKNTDDTLKLVQGAPERAQLGAQTGDSFKLKTAKEIVGVEQPLRVREGQSELILEESGATKSELINSLAQKLEKKHKVGGQGEKIESQRMHLNTEGKVQGGLDSEKLLSLKENVQTSKAELGKVEQKSAYQKFVPQKSLVTPKRKVEGTPIEIEQQRQFERFKKESLSESSETKESDVSVRQFSFDKVMTTPEGKIASASSIGAMASLGAEDVQGVVAEKVDQKQDVINSIIKHVSSLGEKRSGNLSVKLDHPELGNINLAVAKNADGVSISLNTVLKEATSFLEGNKAAILDLLRSSGIEITQFKVIQTSDERLASSKMSGEGQDHLGGFQRRGDEQASQRQNQSNEDSRRREELWKMMMQERELA